MPFCEYCKKRLADPSSLRRHVHEKHPGNSGSVSKATRRHQCSLCNVIFTRAESLRRHARQHEGVAAPCGICLRHCPRDDYRDTHQSNCARKLLAKACTRVDSYLSPGTYQDKDLSSLWIEPSILAGTDRWESRDALSQNPQQRGSSLVFMHEYALDVASVSRALKCLLSRSLDLKSCDDFEEALVFAFRLGIESMPELRELIILAEKELVTFPEKDEAWTRTFLAGVADGDSSAMLLWACVSGFSDILEPLFWRRADFDFSNNLGTPLKLAIRDHHVDTVRFVLALGADPNLQKPIIDAIANGTQEVVALLVRHGASLHDEYIGAMFTPLELAVRKKDLDMVRSLLWLGANPRFDDALRMAILANLPDIAKILMQHGAQLDTIPFRHQGEGRLGPRSVRRVLHEATLASRNDSIKLALSLGADPNVGYPLLFALEAHKPEIAVALVEHGASVVVKNKKSDTPLHIAAAMAHVGLVQAILAQNSSPKYVSAVNMYRLDALHCAIGALAKCRVDQVRLVVKQLLHAGADSKAVGGEVDSALVRAAFYGDVTVVKLLLESKASSHLDHVWLFAALKEAVLCKRANVVYTLLEAGARDEHGRLKSLARSMSEYDIAAMLWIPEFYVPICVGADVGGSR